LGFKTFVEVPDNAKELYNLFLKVPNNTDLIFFHQAGVNQQAYKSGVPPFCRVKKEKNNALNGQIVYVVTDNRRGEQIVTERDLPYKLSELFGNSTNRTDIFNNIKMADICAVKIDSDISLPNLPRPIAGHDVVMNKRPRA